MTRNDAEREVRYPADVGPAMGEPFARLSDERKPMTPAEVADFEAEFGDLPVSRLSHDRVADAGLLAAVERLRAAIPYEVEKPRTYVEKDDIRIVLAALSVPAPTLPALDVERLAEAIKRAVYDAPSEKGDLLGPLDNARDIIREYEALRDAV